MKPPIADPTLGQEAVYHRYRGSRIPWWVRAVWVGFWIFAITYTFRLLIPALRSEITPTQKVTGAAAPAP